MAKLKGGLFPLSGKLGDVVFVQTPGREGYVRRKVRPGTKRNEPALRQHYTRAPQLNNLAAAINSIVKTKSGGLKHPQFYFELLSRFRKQTSDNRFILLSALEGLDIHPRYTLGSLPGHQEISVKAGKKEIKVFLTVKSHPGELPRTNCYCYEVLLLTWTKDDRTPKYYRQGSDWIYLQKPKPKYEFSFKNDGDILHWMLCLKKNMGFNDKNVSVKLQGMSIIKVGTFDKEDIALLKKNAEDEKKKHAAAKEEEDEMVRVKPKGTS